MKGVSSDHDSLRRQLRETPSMSYCGEAVIDVHLFRAIIEQLPYQLFSEYRLSIFAHYVEMTSAYCHGYYATISFI